MKGPLGRRSMGYFSFQINQDREIRMNFLFWENIINLLLPIFIVSSSLFGLSFRLLLQLVIL
jgi:hypothetical protein